MKNRDFLKAKAAFICTMDIAGDVAYILLADNQDAESGKSVVSDSCTGSIEEFRNLLMLLVNRRPELRDCFAPSFIVAASHAPVRFGGDGGGATQSPISQWQRTLPFGFCRKHKER